MAQKGARTLQTVERAIAVLNSFTLEKPERGVSELSRELGLNKSTVSRLMATLEQGGLLSRSPDDDQYRLGLDLIGLAAKVISYLDVRDVARPFLKELAEACQETTTLTVLDQWETLNLERFVPSGRRITNIGQIGLRAPPHAAAAGKVLLAHLPDREVEQFLARNLVRYTAHTITDPDGLRQEILQVRKLGYALAQEELEIGLNVVAAPIYDHESGVVAAVCLAGPAYRVTPESFPDLAVQVKQVAENISKQLGYGLE